MSRRRFAWLNHPVLPAWDGHCHLGACPGRTPVEKMAWLMERAQRLGIRRVIVFMGWPFVYDPSPAELRRQNDQVLKALEHWHDHAYGYCYVSPRHPDASIAEMDRCIRDGPMVGIKLWVAARPTAPGARELIEHATALRAVVFQHTWLKRSGNLPGESTPYDLASVAADYPKTTFICGHAGGNWRVGVRIVEPHDNIVVETAGFDPVAGFLERAIEHLGPQRIIYGSDAAGRSFASQLAKVYGARVSLDQKRLILHENLKRLLLPVLQTKGSTPSLEP